MNKKKKRKKRSSSKNELLKKGEQSKFSIKNIDRETREPAIRPP